MQDWKFSACVAIGINAIAFGLNLENFFTARWQPRTALAMGILNGVTVAVLAVLVGTEKQSGYKGPPPKPFTKDRATLELERIIYGGKGPSE